MTMPMTTTAIQIILFVSSFAICQSFLSKPCSNIGRCFEDQRRCRTPFQTHRHRKYNHQNKNYVVLHAGLKVNIDSEAGLTYDPDGPRIVFTSRKITSKPVVELPNQRTLLEYLALPAEQYSVLDGASITKNPNSSNEFTCELEEVNFLGNRIVANFDAVVDVSDYPQGKSVIRVIGCRLSGSKLANYANGSFDVECTNVVRALRGDTRRQKDVPILSVDCSLQISAIVPREGKWIPKRLLSKSGSVVMQQMLNLLVPRFVKQLVLDFDGWSAGDDSRAPVSKDALLENDDEEDDDDVVMADGGNITVTETSL
mmetsp:Transcript_44881/g.65976  ORF Transcript_44881/g.65976 Transcript_44881/m.65976 type:complete len:313 (+) Transcript_44881:56-994(+)|eukprot:CAMPEP_0195521600 /NCGR_PEP_ID=MMETSP0794_2-20130614/19024_1 /TAXON_ID=515487 /ORGANISM="Stephanopyxis turris, Strain CCMP 815" /LENGTH=312 /DNA_ID=CAMNT_0040651185 /DNA_START=53 /DNA_END=991 /DNA_ORIENTATION=+